MSTDTSGSCFRSCAKETAGGGCLNPSSALAYPGLAALATATYALGRGDCLGTLSLADKDGRAIAFARGDDTAAVAVWRESDEPAELILPLNWEEVREARTHLGTPQLRLVTAGHGPVQVRAARAAVYFVLPPSAYCRESSRRPPGRRSFRATTKSSVRDENAALRRSSCACVCCKATPDKAIDAYRVPAGAAAELQAEVYNFGSRDVSGRSAAVGAGRLED